MQIKQIVDVACSRVSLQFRWYRILIPIIAYFEGDFLKQISVLIQKVIKLDR